jgi:hypothetical protein
MITTSSTAARTADRHLTRRDDTLAKQPKEKYNNNNNDLIKKKDKAGATAHGPRSVSIAAAAAFLWF